MDIGEAAEFLRDAQEFEWDEAKRLKNIEVHGIDFADAPQIFDQPFVISASPRGGEMRYLVIALLQGREVAVICTIRGRCCRFISTRKARTYERQSYHSLLKTQAGAR